MQQQLDLASALQSRISRRAVEIHNFEKTRTIAKAVKPMVARQMYDDILQPLAEDQYVDRKILKLLQRSNAAGFLL